VPDDRDMDIVLFTFVEKNGKLFLADELGQPASGGDIAGGQGSKGGCIDPLGVPGTGDQLTILVHKKNDLGVCTGHKAFDHIGDKVELFLVQNEIG